MNNQCLSPTKENAKNMQNRSSMMLYRTVKKWMVGGVSREAAAGLRGLKRRLLRCKSAEKGMTIIMILDYLDMVSERHRET
jgi:hypothetical protein